MTTFATVQPPVKSTPSQPGPAPATRRLLRKRCQPRPPAAGQESLTAREVAFLLNVSLRTVWRWSRLGVLPAPFRTGRVVRWSRAEVLDWVQSHRGT